MILFRAQAWFPVYAIIITVVGPYPALASFWAPTSTSVTTVASESLGLGPFSSNSNSHPAESDLRIRGAGCSNALCDSDEEEGYDVDGRPPLLGYGGLEHPRFEGGDSDAYSNPGYNSGGYHNLYHRPMFIDSPPSGSGSGSGSSSSTGGDREVPRRLESKATSPSHKGKNGNAALEVAPWVRHSRYKRGKQKQVSEPEAKKSKPKKKPQPPKTFPDPRSSMFDTMSKDDHDRYLKAEAKAGPSSKTERKRSSLRISESAADLDAKSVTE